MTLGEELASASRGVLNLMLKTKDLEKKKVLRKQLTGILEETARLVEINVASNTKAYRDATAGLQTANVAIDKAMKDLQNVAKAIKKIAKAIDLLAKVAAAMA